MIFATTVYVVSAAWLAYCYAGYAVIVMLLAKLRPVRHCPDDSYTPQVAMLITAHNEERDIGAKIHNALSLDYPVDRLHIFVASDGSRDRTNEIVSKAEVETDRVTLFAFPTNRGKTAALIDAVARLPASTQVVIFSDANSTYLPDAIRRLVRHFSNDRIGCVAGELVYTSPTGERTYRRFENRLRELESHIGVTVGAEGSIYAVRHSAIPRIDASLIDDFTIPLLIQAQGNRVVYDSSAISTEAFDLGWRQQFRRRRRIVNRCVRSARTVHNIWNPFKYGLPAIAFLSHRWLRWLSALPALSLVICGFFILITAQGLWRVPGVLSTAIALLAMIGYLTADMRTQLPLTRYPFLLASSMLAMLLGVASALRGQAVVTWTPVRPN